MCVDIYSHRDEVGPFTGVSLQVRAMMTELAFSIEELEELYCLFKVRGRLRFCPP